MLMHIQQHTIYKCSARITGTKLRHTKITNTCATDFFEQLFLTEQITQEQWQLILNIRRLASTGRRSQGIRVRLQSHSQYWGMPHICAQDSYVNARAERRWKLFLFYLKPFAEHQWLDRQMLELLLHGGHVIFAGGSADRKTLASNVACVERQSGHPPSDLAQLGFTIDTVHYALLVIEYVFEKTYRRR